METTTLWKPIARRIALGGAWRLIGRSCSRLIVMRRPKGSSGWTLNRAGRTAGAVIARRYGEALAALSDRSDEWPTAAV